MDQVKIPSNIDEPVRILFFRIDSFILFVGLWMFGFYFQHPWYGFMVAAFISLQYEKIIQESQHGWLKNFAYWIGFQPKKGLTIVDPYIREYYK